MVLIIHSNSFKGIAHVTHLISKPWLRVVLLKQAPTPVITVLQSPVTVHTITPEITHGVNMHYILKNKQKGNLSNT